MIHESACRYHQCTLEASRQMRYLGDLPSFIDGLLITRMISKMISHAILSHDLQQVYSPYQEFFSGDYSQDRKAT
jgi:hypothetical protein